MPGPSRQFTLVSFGNATGTVGVEVNVGGGVLVGKGVCVGESVGSGCVTVGEADACSVGVSVAGRFEGRLQASIAKMSTSAGNKVRDFIVSPLLVHPSYLIIILLTIDHLDSSKQNRADESSARFCFTYFITGYGNRDFP